jgi:hypothetical protein
MRLTAAFVAATILGFAAPASGADYANREHGWRHHHRHHAHAHHGHRRYHQGRFYAEEAVSVVEYREPYLPRGVLYNAPPLPLADAYTSHRGYGGDVISARY